MNLDDLYETVKNETYIDLHLYFIIEENGEYEFLKVDLKNTNTRDTLNSITEKFLSVVKDYDEQDYDFGTKQKKSYSILEVEEVPQLNEFYETFINWENFEKVSDFSQIKDSQFYGLHIQMEESFIFAITKLQSSFLIDMNTSFIFNNQKLSLKEDDSIRILDKFDCIITNPKAFVFNNWYFERIFKFKEQILQSVKEFSNDEVINRIVTDWDNIIDKINDNEWNLRKFAKIMRNRPFEKIKIDSLKDVIYTYDIEMEFIGDTIKIPENPNHSQVKAVLYALNDDLTRSLTSDIVYALTGEKNKVPKKTA
jgi:hypothetical protein